VCNLVPLPAVAPVVKRGQISAKKRGISILALNVGKIGEASTSESENEYEEDDEDMISLDSPVDRSPSPPLCPKPRTSDSSETERIQNHHTSSQSNSNSITPGLLAPRAHNPLRSNSLDLGSDKAKLYHKIVSTTDLLNLSNKGIKNSFANISDLVPHWRMSEEEQSAVKHISLANSKMFSEPIRLALKIISEPTDGIMFSLAENFGKIFFSFRRIYTSSTIFHFSCRFSIPR